MNFETENDMFLHVAEQQNISKLRVPKLIKNQKLLYKLPVEVARTDFLQNQNLDCLFTVKYINLNNIYFMFMFLFNFTADIRYYNKERSSCIEIFRCVLINIYL